MLDIDTRRRIDTARDILVGKLPDPKSQVEQITIALIYKFMDDMDREALELGGKAKFFTGEYQRYAWTKIFDPRLSGYELVNVYGEAVQKMNQNPNIPQLFRDIFKNAFLPYRDPETLKSFLKIINDFEYDHSEKLGDAFEYLLSVLGSQGEAGQFRTPRHIIDFMVAIVDPKKNESILDPACGTAGFLISSYKHILKHNSENFDLEKDPSAFELHGVRLEEITINSKKYSGDKLTSDDKERLVKNIIGYDISPDMVRLSLVNMYLHGFSNPRIFEYDTLTSEEKWNEYADVIMANPPFMSPKGGIRPHKRFSIESSRSEVLFVDYIAEHLTPQGRAAVIVPEGIIFQVQTAHKNLRKMLIEKDYLVGVISLPAGVFNPYSAVKTSILWMDKTLAKKTDRLIFVRIDHDGFDLGAQRRPIKQNDLPNAFHAIQEYKKSIDIGGDFNADKWQDVLIVQKSKIAENDDYNLTGERYKPAQGFAKQKWPMVKLGELCEVLDNRRKPVKEADRRPGPYPYYGAMGIVDYVDEYIFDEKLVLVGEDGAKWAKGEKTAFIADGKYWVNNHAHVLRPDRTRIIDELLVALLSEMDLTPYIAGLTVPKLTQDNLRLIEIPLPPLEVQGQIVAEISTYQKIIDGAQQVINDYKPHIDIDPSWPVFELGEVLSLEYGAPLKSEDRVDGPYPVYGSNGIIGYHNQYMIEGPTIVVGRKGTAGAVNYSTKNLFPIDTTFYVQLKTNCNLKFIYYQMLDMKLGEINTQSGVPGLNRNDAYEKKIFVPDIQVQDQIVDHLENEQSLVDANRQLVEIFEQKIKDRIAQMCGEK